MARAFIPLRAGGGNPPPASTGCSACPGGPSGCRPAVSRRSRPCSRPFQSAAGERSGCGDGCTFCQTSPASFGPGVARAVSALPPQYSRGRGRCGLPRASRRRGRRRVRPRARAGLGGLSQCFGQGNQIREGPRRRRVREGMGHKALHWF